MPKQLVELITTFFYIGYLPGAPGSIATAATVLLWVILRDAPVVYLLTFVTVTVAGFLASGRMEHFAKKKDPGCVVIDEVSGTMIAFWGLPVYWPVIFTGYFLFRAFDMFKIYPANKLEHIHGSTGIMMDDIVAGVYANIVMRIALHWAGYM